MRYIILLILSISPVQDNLLFNFTATSNLSNWRIVDDVVMGGRSFGKLSLTQEGYGKFSGEVSLENNGGFSSVRYNFETKETATYSEFVLRIKGDGKRYQFRVKDKFTNRYAFIFEFPTTGKWETIRIPFYEMYASFRGYRLDLPNFKGNQMEEIAFLIGNKKEENFVLLIDFIALK